ncbi:hypothetical protein R6Q59_033819 [Mikania micrantha]
MNLELTSKLKTHGNKQLHTKNFMNPTISAAIKASVPRKKILGERNETLDTVERSRLKSSYSFGSRSEQSSVVDSDGDMEKDLVSGPCLQPYDPVTNYLSPRPKFLRYNPNRRRKKILILQENDGDRVKISTYFDAGNAIHSSDLHLGFSDSCSQQESVSCSQQESVEEAQHVNSEKDDEDEEEEMIDFGEDSCCSLRGFFKFLFVVIAVILTTQAICSIKSSSPSQTIEPVWGVNHVYGLNNFSEVGYGLIREPDLVVGELREGGVYGHSYYSLDMSETNEEFVVVQDAKTVDHDFHDDEVEDFDDSNVIQDEILQERDYIEAETVHEDVLTEEDDSCANESNPQLTNEAESEVKTHMEDVEEKVFDDIQNNDVLIKVTSFDPTIAVLIIGHVLILTSFGVIYCSKRKKSSASVIKPVEKEEFMDLEPSTIPESMIQQKEVAPSLQNETSKLHIPSVELLGEFVFDEEITSNISTTENHPSNSLIQTTEESFSKTKSSHMEGDDSHTIKKHRRKNLEVVTPSSVRRSSRLRTRSVMSP